MHFHGKVHPCTCLSIVLCSGASHIYRLQRLNSFRGLRVCLWLILDRSLFWAPVREAAAESVPDASDIARPTLRGSGGFLGLRGKVGFLSGFYQQLTCRFRALGLGAGREGLGLQGLSQVPHVCDFVLRIASESGSGLFSRLSRPYTDPLKASYMWCPPPPPLPATWRLPSARVWDLLVQV